MAAIRPMTGADINAVAALARVVWQDAYPAIITQAQIDYMLDQRYRTEVLQAELADPGITWDLLEENGQVIGFASCQTMAPGEMKLDKLYVHPSLQRRGHGGALVRHCMERAWERGCRTLILAVNKGNLRAIAAYRKYGFEVQESIVKDIGNGFVMDDFIMSIELV